MTPLDLTPTEHAEQVQLFQWAEWEMPRRPELRLLHAIPNGGFRHPATAARLKAEGLKPGIPDIFLPVARRGYYGLYVELKRVKGGTVSPEQARVIGLLREQGYRVDICRGFDEAKAAIEDYLG